MKTFCVKEVWRVRAAPRVRFLYKSRLEAYLDSGQPQNERLGLGDQV